MKGKAKNDTLRISETAAWLQSAGMQVQICNEKLSSHEHNEKLRSHEHSGFSDMGLGWSMADERNRWLR